MKATGSFVVISAALALLAAEPKTPPGDKVFLYWDINSSLGLPGGPTPSQVAAGTPVARSDQEIECLKNSVRTRMQAYKKIEALYVVQTIGGDPVTFFAAGYKLSLAQARLSWATGHASETVARLQQAEEFAGVLADAVEVNGMHAERSLSGPTDSADATEESNRVKISVYRVRAALEKLGYDLSDVAKQSRISLPKRKR